MSAPRLCIHLEPLLAAELAAGNTVKDEGIAPGSHSGRMVLLGAPFAAAPATVSPPLTHNQINDPHWWLAEFSCTEHGDLLACSFAVSH